MLSTIVGTPSPTIAADFLARASGDSELSDAPTSSMRSDRGGSMDAACYALADGGGSVKDGCVRLPGQWQSVSKT
jgi:hypothetical protein